MTDTTAPRLVGDILTDAEMIADNLGLRVRFSQPGGARQLTVYGVDYDGTGRHTSGGVLGRPTPATDKVRITDHGSHALILSLTGNNTRTAEKRITAANEPDREELTEILTDILGDIA